MTCDVCQRAKRVNRKPVPLRHLPEAGLFDFLSLDTIGALPESPLGYKYALTVQDWFSGYPEIIPLKSLKAGEIADALYQVFTGTGVPLRIMSDLHASLMSEIMNKLTQVLRIKHLKSSSVHHQSILVERLHRTIGQTFRAYIGEQSGWCDLIPAVLYAYRATNAVKSTNFSPFYLAHGKEMRLAIDTSFLIDTELAPQVDEYARQLLPKVQLTERIVLANRRAAGERNKENYDRKTKNKEFQIGDMLLLSNEATKRGSCHKLEQVFSKDVYIVTQVCGNDNYKLRNMETGKVLKHVFHANRLKQYLPPTKLLDTEEERMSEGKQNVGHGEVGTHEMQRGEKGQNAEGQDEETRATTTRRRVHFADDSASSTTTGQAVGEKKAEKKKGDTGWFPIKQIISRKGFGPQLKFLVEFMNGEQRWTPARNVNLEAKNEFYGRMRDMGRTFRRKRKNY